MKTGRQKMKPTTPCTMKAVVIETMISRAVCLQSLSTPGGYLGTHSSSRFAAFCQLSHRFCTTSLLYFLRQVFVRVSPLRTP